MISLPFLILALSRWKIRSFRDPSLSDLLRIIRSHWRPASAIAFVMCKLHDRPSGTGLALIHDESVPGLSSQPISTAIGRYFRTHYDHMPQGAWQQIEVLILFCVTFAFSALPARAETFLSGTYSCTKVEVAGKTRPCAAVARIWIRTGVTKY